MFSFQVLKEQVYAEFGERKSRDNNFDFLKISSAFMVTN